MNKFWHACDKSPGGVRRDWQALMGDEFDRWSDYFQAIDKLSESYPMEDTNLSRWEVFEGKDGFVGLHDEVVGMIRIPREELVIYVPDFLYFCKQICNAFGFEPSLEYVSEWKHTVHVGTYRPLSGYQFPVYFLRPTNPALSLTELINSSAQGPMLLLSLRQPRYARREPTERIGRLEATTYVLEDSIDVLDDLTFRLNETGHELLERFNQLHLPQKPVTDEGIAFFPTPAGARWKDVRLRFVDAHTISVNVCGETRRYDFKQMGMGRNRSSLPTVQWDLLYAFSMGKGVIDWDSPGASRKNDKRKDRLALHLRDFFRIEGEPFVREGNGWKTRFQIESDQ